MRSGTPTGWKPMICGICFLGRQTRVLISEISSAPFGSATPERTYRGNRNLAPVRPERRAHADAQHVSAPPRSDSTYTMALRQPRQDGFVHLTTFRAIFSSDGRR